MDISVIGSIASLVALIPLAAAGTVTLTQHTGGRRLLRLSRGCPLDIVTTTSDMSLSKKGPRVRRATTGHGQVQGIAQCAQCVGHFYWRKRIRVYMSRQVTDTLTNDLVILGGLKGNEIAETFAAKLCDSFGRPIFRFNDESTMDVSLDSYSVEGYDLQLDKTGTINRDLGAVVIWRNPFTDDWRRAVMCIGFSTYGTADAARWVFEQLIPGSTAVWVKTFKRYRSARRAVRRRECCLALLEFQYGGGHLQVPLGAPKLRYFGHFADPEDSRKKDSLARVGARTA
jgi:hypothetical protein